MVPEQQRLSPAERDNLVAYLDHELNPAEERAIATKLTLSISARRELEALKNTWELLDYLPRPEPSVEMTARTVSQARLLDQRNDRLMGLASRATRDAGKIAALALSACATLLVAYALTCWVWPDPSSRLIRDLSLAEHLDEYRDVGTFAFLKELDNSPEFTTEISRFAARPVSDSEDRGQRLLSMPREERQRLAENLERFDRLERPRREALFELDQQLARLSPQDRGRYESLLRRYHLFVQALPEPRRQELADAGDEQRLVLIKRLREANRAQTRTIRNILLRSQVALSGPVSLFELARLLKVWSDLPPGERQAIDKLRQDTERIKRLRELARAAGSGSPEASAKQDWADVLRRLNSNPRSKTQLETLKARNKGQVGKRAAEALFFLGMEEEAPVDARKLHQFETILPGWVRAQIDPLPPEGARRRLAALYRLIYPPGTEMADPEPQEPAEPGKPAQDGKPLRPPTPKGDFVPL